MFCWAGCNAAGHRGAPVPRLASGYHCPHETRRGLPRKLHVPGLHLTHFFSLGDAPRTQQHPRSLASSSWLPEDAMSTGQRKQPERGGDGVLNGRDRRSSSEPKQTSARIPDANIDRHGHRGRGRGSEVLITPESGPPVPATWQQHPQPRDPSHRQMTQLLLRDPCI